MTKVLPLSRWKDFKLAERNDFSDNEDDLSADEESDEDEPVDIPRKRKSTGANKAAKKPRLRIPKKPAIIGGAGMKRPVLVPPGPPEGPPPKKPRINIKPSQIPSKS